MKPAAHFNIYDVRQWQSLTLPVLAKQMEKMWKAIKKATGYTWDNTEFFICDIRDKVALQVLFHHDAISFWDNKTGFYIGSYPKVDAKQIEEFVEHSSKGEVLCCDCKKYIVATQMIQFGFAGGVCKKCYNPEKHLPPDTRGD